MRDIHSIALLQPMAVGVVAVICTVFIHALPLSATLRFLSLEKRFGRVGVSFWRDTQIVVSVILLALVAHLTEIAFWAALLVVCGEFTSFGTAYYHSAVNYTSLGYGDIVMSPAWRLLGPIETANGMLLFGVSTAMTYAVLHRLVEVRYADLRE